MNAGLHFASHQEDDVARAVIGAKLLVFRRPPAEFGKRRQQHPIELSLGLEVFAEEAQRLAQFLKQASVAVKLRRMRVEAAERHVKHPRRHVGHDHLRDKRSDWHRAKGGYTTAGLTSRTTAFIWRAPWVSLPVRVG